MAQYVARFCPKYSLIVEPLRKLTHKDIDWKWGQEEENAFLELKEAMANWNMVKYFDIRLHTELVVDAGPRGLGAILSQIGLDGKAHVVEYGSRALSDTESRYSQTERETLAVVWGCEHFSHYLEGSDFTVVTDHKPLEGIMRKTTAQPTARIYRLLLRLQPYRIDIVYRPGKSNPADYLSRHVRWARFPTEKSWLDDQTCNVVIHAVHSYDLTLDELKEETSRDECLQQVITAIATGKWHLVEKQHNAYLKIRDELSVAEGLVIRGERIVIPEILQNRVVNIAHSSHQGIVKTKTLLRETVWFPGIDRLVEKVVASCLPCQANIKVKNTEPLQMTALPEGPWKELSVDFCGPFSTGEYLLVVIDDFSRFPEVETLYSTSYEATKPKLDAIFSRQGYPEVLKSDNGPPFQGQEFADWAKEKGFTHRKITPLWPQANGEAERFMRSLGKAIKSAVVEKKNWKNQINTFLRHYRATPHCTTGLSPCEMLNKRKLRTEIPVFTKKGRVIEDKIESARLKDDKAKIHMKELADERNHAKENTFEIGDKVLVRQPQYSKLTSPYKPAPFEVIEKKGTMVTVENDQGRMTRNSSHMKKIPQYCEATEEHTQEPAAIETDTESTCVSDTSERRSSRIRAKPKHLEEFVC